MAALGAGTGPVAGSVVQVFSLQALYGSPGREEVEGEGELLPCSVFSAPHSQPGAPRADPPDQGSQPVPNNSPCCRAVYKEHPQQFSRLYFKNFTIHICEFHDPFHKFHYFRVVLTRKAFKLGG